MRERIGLGEVQGSLADEVYELRLRVADLEAKFEDLSHRTPKTGAKKKKAPKKKTS